MAKRGMSLHIGLNTVDPKHYAGWSGPLKACEGDAKDMFAIAKKVGFDAAEPLLTSSATRSAVRDHITAAAEKLSSGDIFFITYSGHGGQLPDLNGDEDDLCDETWCLFNSQFVDDELWQLWSKFKKGVRILVLSDSCHSGTVTKNAFDALSNDVPAARMAAAVLGVDAPRYRYMPDDVALRTYRNNQEQYDVLGQALPKDSKDIEVQASVRLISGCHDNQVSLDGTFNGLFTGMLLRVWNRGKYKENYTRFHNDILRLMPPTQTPNHFVQGTPNPAYDAELPFTI